MSARTRVYHRRPVEIGLVGCGLWGVNVLRDLRTLGCEARRLTRISLSVDDENPVKRPYVRLGYVDYEPGDDLGRMILDLA